QAEKYADLEVLRRKYAAIDEYLRGVDERVSWLEAQLDLVAEILPIQDAEALVHEAVGWFQAIIQRGPAPTTLTFSGDLHEAKGSLGSSWDAARTELGELWVTYLCRLFAGRRPELESNVDPAACLQAVFDFLSMAVVWMRWHLLVTQDLHDQFE